jgi:hypothetical protein
MKTHTMHFTGANGEAVSVSFRLRGAPQRGSGLGGASGAAWVGATAAVTSCSNQEPICAVSAARLLHGSPIQVNGSRVEGATVSCPRDFPAAEDAHKAEERKRTMRTERNKATSKKVSRLIEYFGLCALLGFAPPSVADTIITGPNISGTWSPSGNCYIITSDCTVPSGQSLIIQPGTCVQIASGVSLTANGMIQAVGTPAQRITFQAPISSQTWNTIVAQGTAGTNQFNYCDFLNATNALDFRGASVNQVMNCTFSNASIAIVFRDRSVNAALSCNIQNVMYGIWMTFTGRDSTQMTTQTTKIMNCTFSNCTEEAISGDSYGQAWGVDWYNYWAANGTLNASIRNCVFNNSGNGCGLYVAGQAQGGCCGTFVGYGYGNLQVLNNVFNNVTNSAIWLGVGTYAGGGPAALINNTVVNAGRGVLVQDPWDATVQSCLFVGCTNAVRDTGTLSRTVSYNGFYGNATNFTGYNPNSYGSVIKINRNGTPCDLLFNIFDDPKFVATNDFHLQTTSPAIDAGSPDWAYTDMCFAPQVSQGTAYPDLGVYGGPDAANWLDTVPLLPVQASISLSTNLIWLNWGAIPRSTYQIQYVATNLNATFGTNAWLTKTNVLAADKPVSIAVSPYPATNPAAFYRIQSLGRMPGD